MEYMFLINVDESQAPTDRDSPEAQQMFAAWMQYNQKLIDGGHWVSGASLLPSGTATVVHKAGGAPTTMTDGPFAETKEQLGGYYLVSATDLDQALALAGAMPLPSFHVEVRPVMFRPDAVPAEV